jgi:hypothetical protein
MKKFDIQIFLQFTSAFTIVQDSTNTLLTSEVGYRSTPKKQSAQNTVLTWHVRLFRSRARMCVVGFFRFVVMHAQEAGIRIDFFLRSAGQELSETVRVKCLGLQPAVAMADYDEFGAPMPAKKGTLLLTAGIAGIGGALLG